jgi:hypothetical protein
MNDELERGSVDLDGLDGPRSRSFDLPVNWHSMSEAEQDAIVRPIRDELINDAVAWSVDAPLYSNCECHHCGYNS